LAVGAAPGAVDAGHPARANLLEELVAGDLGGVEAGGRRGLRLRLRGRALALALRRRDAGAPHRLDARGDDEADREGREDQRGEGAVDAADGHRPGGEARGDDEEPDGEPRGGAQQCGHERRGDRDQHDRHSSTSAMMSVMLSGPPRSFASAIRASTDDCRLVVRSTSARTSSGVTSPWRPSEEMTKTSPFSTPISMTSGATCGRVPSTLVMRLRHSWLLASS